MKRLYSIFIVFSAFLVPFIQSSQTSAITLTPFQVAVLYKAYDEYGDDFINYLPASIEQCKQQLIIEQSTVQDLINSHSYASIFFSQNTGLLMASLVGMWAVGNKLNMNTLAYEVANDFANALFRDAGRGYGGLLMNGKPRVHPNAEIAAFDAATAKGYNVSFGDITRAWPDEVWREIVPNLPEEQRNYQIIENAPVSRIEQLQMYQLGYQALAAVQAISGFGLYKDIQAMRAKKAALTDDLKKINAMLAVLERGMVYEH